MIAVLPSGLKATHTTGSVEDRLELRVIGAARSESRGRAMLPVDLQVPAATAEPALDEPQQAKADIGL